MHGEYSDKMRDLVNTHTHTFVHAWSLPATRQYACEMTQPSYCSVSQLLSLIIDWVIQQGSSVAASSCTERDTGIELKRSTLRTLRPQTANTRISNKYYARKKRFCIHRSQDFPKNQSWKQKVLGTKTGDIMKMRDQQVDRKKLQTWLQQNCSRYWLPSTSHSAGNITGHL